MVLTPIGWLLIPLGIILFIVRPHWLYVLTIFFAPFSATSIINTGGGDSGQGFSPFLFFGFLLLLREYAGVAFRMKIRILPATQRPLNLLYLFTAVCLVSLIMPLIINGRLDVMSSPGLDYRLVPLEFNRQILNHAIRLVFDIALTTVIVYRNKELKSFYATLRIYLCSGVFVCLWGLMQFALYILRIPYPAFIFNNSATPNAQDYSAAFESVGIVRMSSVAIEPVFLSRVLVGMLAICIVAVRGRKHIFNSYTDYIIVLLLFFTILLATSSTGYVGVAVLLVMLLFVPSSLGKSRTSSSILVFTVVLAVVISYYSFPSVKYILNSQLLNKNSTGSAIERAIIMYNDLQYFLMYPILGIGWNCAPTHDVIIGMLATCGLVGLSAFLLLIGTILYKLKQNFYLQVRQINEDSPSIMMFLCLSVTCAVYVVSGGIEPPDFWVILALSIAAVGIGHNLRRNTQVS